MAESEYEKFIKVHLIRKDSYLQNRWQKIKQVKQFCKNLGELGIDYHCCIQHPEVLGCQESEQYYQRFSPYLGEDYSICKNLVLRERKGQKRIILLITTNEKSIDLKKLQILLETSKLEFAPETDLENYLDTYPGNVSLFNVLADTEKKVQVIIDQELLEKELLAFHPLYNGMSLFLPPKEALKFLNKIDHPALLKTIPEKEIKVLTKSEKLV